jgi:phage baseplate assembly protein gpV
MIFFVIGNEQDQIVVAGVPDYPSNAPEFAADKPVVRAVIGGTGKYNGAGGQLTSTRNADGSYKQEFSLTKP